MSSKLLDKFLVTGLDGKEREVMVSLWDDGHISYRSTVIKNGKPFGASHPVNLNKLPKWATKELLKIN
jgi:hypothetical protein